MSAVLDSINIDKLVAGGGMVVIVGLFVIAILILVGMGYLTSVAFNKNKWEDLTTAQKDFARMAMVFFWMAFVVNILYLIKLSMGKRSALYYF